MTSPWRKTYPLFYISSYLLLTICGAIGNCVAASTSTSTLDTQMAEARMAITRAERLQPLGIAAESLAEAQQQYASAQAALERKKNRDAQRFAQQAQAAADLALARAQLAQARLEVDDKSIRNAELRRQLLVLPESSP